MIAYPIHRQYPAQTQRPVIVCSPLVRSQAIKDTRTMVIRMTRVVCTKNTIFAMILVHFSYRNIDLTVQHWQL